MGKGVLLFGYSKKSSEKIKYGERVNKSYCRSTNATLEALEPILYRRKRE